MKKEKLVLGAAGKPDPDAITLDIDPQHNPDVVHDLHHIPWPFEDDQFKEVSCHHVLEHLNDLEETMRELYRICRPDGHVYIEVPHHSSWMAHDPEHKLYFSSLSFNTWVADEKTWRTGSKKFKLLKRQVSFHRSHRRFGLHKLFNKFPMEYERFWTYLVPAEHLKVWLQPLK